MCALWPSEINALRNIHASKAFCGTNHTIILDNRGKTFGFGLNDKGQVGSDVPLHTYIQDGSVQASKPEFSANYN